jgi:hypothetical protein
MAADVYMHTNEQINKQTNTHTYSKQNPAYLDMTSNSDRL